MFSKVPVSLQTERVTEWLACVETPMVLCSGNHDLEGDGGAWLGGILSPTKWGNGTHLSIGGVTFVSSAWGAPFLRDRRTDVLLCHVPPAGCATAVSRVDGTDVGDFGLGEDLRSELFPVPDLVLAGHQHWPRRWHDWCGAAVSLNPGLNPRGAVPNYILLDLSVLRRAVLHVDGEPAEAENLPRSPYGEGDDRIAGRANLPTRSIEVPQLD